MHLGDGLCQLRSIDLLLGGKGTPQKAQRIGHREDRTEDIGHKHHIARHAGQELFVHGGFQHGLFSHEAKQWWDAGHGEPGNDRNTEKEGLLAPQAG